MGQKLEQTIESHHNYVAFTSTLPHLTGDGQRRREREGGGKAAAWGNPGDRYPMRDGGQKPTDEMGVT